MKYRYRLAQSLRLYLCPKWHHDLYTLVNSEETPLLHRFRNALEKRSLFIVRLYD